jgi:hypothetical protein
MEGCNFQKKSFLLRRYQIGWKAGGIATMVRNAIGGIFGDIVPGSSGVTRPFKNFLWRIPVKD